MNENINQTPNSTEAQKAAQEATKKAALAGKEFVQTPQDVGTEALKQ